MKVILLLSILVVLECGSPVDAQNGAGPFSGFRNDSLKMADAINNFGLKLYKGLAKNQNLVYSGYGVATSLNILLAGARTTTEKELRDVLGYNAAGLTKDQAEASYHDILRKHRRRHHRYILSVENTIFIQSGSTVLPEYNRTLREVFYAQEEMTNFTSPKSINVTDNNFQKLLDAPIDRAARSMLLVINAMPFNATWQHKFNKNLTTLHPFKTCISTTDVLFMNTVNVFNYYENKNVKILELPYAGGDLTMIIFLPRTVIGIFDFEKSLNLSTIEMFRKNARITTVHVKIPKFTTSSSLQLSNVLKSIGMKNSFTSAADFTGIETQRGLYVSEAMQLAVMTVTEDGTEGASTSATRVKRQVSPPSASKPVWFTADHPFMYAVFDRPTGLVLLLGRKS